MTEPPPPTSHAFTFHASGLTFSDTLLVGAVALEVERLMAVRIQGKVVVITGASSGIGRELARVFAREGARVVIAARRGDRLRDLASEIERNGGECLAVPTDVADREAVRRLLDAALERFGTVDVWINNAGSGLLGPVEQTTPEEMRQLWEVNYMGVFHGSQLALSVMRRQGSGHILNVSSLAGRFALPLSAGYSAAKAAVTAFTDALAVELAGSGIHVTSLWVGLTDTEFGEAQVKKMEWRPTTMGPSASAESVARRILRCVQRPRPVEVFAPLPRLALAFFDLFPEVWRMLGRHYVRRRTRAAAE